MGPWYSDEYRATRQRSTWLPHRNIGQEQQRCARGRILQRISLLFPQMKRETSMYRNTQEAWLQCAGAQPCLRKSVGNPQAPDQKYPPPQLHYASVQRGCCTGPSVSCGRGWSPPEDEDRSGECCGAP